MEHNINLITNAEEQTIKSINKTIELLNAKIEIDDSLKKNLTLFIGLTGSGKSTVCQFLIGNENLTAKENDANDFYISDGNNKISDATVISKTLYPELLSEPTTGNILADCPGFADTRSAAHDIAATVLTKKLLQNSENIKIVVTTNSHAVRKGRSRSEFTDLLKHVANFFKDVDNFRDSLALLVTKVENNYRKTVMVSDEDTVKGIANFLSELKQTFNGTDHLEPDHLAIKKLKILDTFLTNVNGSYTRIGLFRTPEDSGTLLNIPAFQDSRKKLTNLIFNELSFANVSQSDFGLTISADSKIVFNEMVQTIEQHIANIFDELCFSIETEYSRKIDDEQSSLKELQDEFINFSNLNHTISNKSSQFSFQYFFAWLHDNKIGFNKQTENDFEKHNKLIYFMNTVSMGNTGHTAIYSSLSRMKIRLVSFHQSILTHSQINVNRLERLNDQYIGIVVGEICQFVKNYYQNEIKNSPNNLELHEKFTQSSKITHNWFVNISKTSEGSMTLKVFYKNISEFLRNIKIVLSPELLEKMETGKSNTELLKNTTGTYTADGQLSEWTKKIPILLDYFLEMSNWFIFTNNLAEKFSETEIQQGINE
jgi:hypothetical protein